MADLKHKRGTKKRVTIPVPGDHTNREIIFTVKRGYKETDDRVIEKKKSLGEIDTTYDSTKNVTNCSFWLLKNDTTDLAISNYPYDIDSISLTDPEDIDTPAGGALILLQDVRTPFDGTALSSSATRYVNLDASEAEVGDVIQCKLVSGVKVFQLITLTELKKQLDLL